MPKACLGCGGAPLHLHDIFPLSCLPFARRISHEIAIDEETPCLLYLQTSRMAPQISDRWLWLGAGLIFFLAAKGIRYAISDIVQLIELEPTEDDNTVEDAEAPEDAISLETLRTLAFSPNPSIALAARGLIITRFASLPDAGEIITRDLSSSDESVKARARTAINYLSEWDEALSVHAGPRTPPFAVAESMEAGPERTLLTQALQEIDHGTRSRAETSARALRHLAGFTNGVPQGSYSQDAQNVVSRLEELAATGFPAMTDEQWTPGTAPFAGWDSIPSQRQSVAETEAERRRRRREAMVVFETEGDAEDVER